jgi:uncharacterized protein (DUF1015 family)
MPDVRPFKGIRYNPGRVPDLSAVITQPYDKISPKMQEEYYNRDRNSFVRLILPKDQDPYAASKATLDKWLHDSTLIRDHTPAFYVIEQEFVLGGRRYKRRGFIGVVRVEEFDKGEILAHERTLQKPKADRLSMVRTTEKDYEQIFLLYSDPEGAVDAALAPSGKPVMEATDDYGVLQRVWAVTDPAKLRQVHALMAKKTLLIADGHHRYETALNYRKEREAAGTVDPDAALRFKTTAFINIADPGLVILPTHRLLYGLGSIDWDAAWRKIRQWFAVYQVADELAPLELANSFWLNGHVFSLHAGKGRTWMLRLKDRRAVDKFVADRSADYKGLAVTVLHTLLIDQVFGVPPEKVEDHVAYERKPEAALARVDSGEFQLALLLNPTRAEQVSQVAGRGERMPQKSTDFYPKLVSGLVFFDIGPKERV